MKNRLLILSLALLILAAFAVSCGESETPDINNLGNKYTAASTTTKKLDSGGVVVGPGGDSGLANVYSIASSSLRMIPWKVESDNDKVATGAILGTQGIQIVGVGEGSTSLTVYDDFGNTLRLSVDVDSEKTVTCKPFTPFYKDKSINVVIDLGVVANDGKEDTELFQKAIDTLAETGGGTVYVPRGTYETGLLQIKENIHLVLAGQVDDATKGYTDEVKARVDGGEFAILKAQDHDMFHNLKAGSHGTTGVDNYSITGGVLDMQGKSRCILLICADNASLTNIIMKDCLNDHAIQVTGSTNITIRNVMFAGYNTGDNLTTGEEVQIEAGVDGATGGGIGRFGDGEYYFCKNVVIDKCYFGPSDKFGPQTIAIGHHGIRNKSDVDGLTISNCVFEDSKTYSIKTTSYSNVKILNNKFTSSKDNRARGGNDSFIYVVLANHDVTAKQHHPDTGLNETAVLAKACSMQGTQNMQISGNTFTMNGTTAVRRVIVAQSNKYTIGADTVVKMLKYTTYGQRSAYYSGYIPVQNVIYNLVVTNNRVTVNCTESEFDDNLMKFDKIVGLTYSGNTITSKFEYKDEYEGQKGVKVTNSIVGDEMYTRVIRMRAFSDASIGVMLPTASGNNVKVTASGTPQLTLKSDGNGEIMLNYEDNGSLTVTFNPKTGYKFAGWTVEESGDKYEPTGDTKLSSSLTLVAKFTR